MYYRSGTAGHYCVYSGVDSPHGSTLLRRVMTSWLPSLKCDIKLKIQLCQSVC